MPPSIRKAAVLGAGVMGAQIAAHLANAGISSLLLDIVPNEAQTGTDRSLRNRIAGEALARLAKIKPNPFFSPELESLIEIGNLEDDLQKLGEVDWVLEAVVENLDVKKKLFARVSSVIRPGTFVSTNTSGIRIADICEGADAGFKRHFLGTHFFNPPRTMRLLELIPIPETLPEVTQALTQFGEEVLGKGIVVAKDTPGFVANRIGTFAVCYILHAMEQAGASIEEIDLLTGPLSGKPKSATFRTLDLVGLDTFVHVAENLYRDLPDDDMRSTFKLPEFVVDMLERKLLGEKTGQGFYKRVTGENGESEILVLDLSTLEYRPRRKVHFPSVETAKGAQDLRQRLEILLSAKDKGGELIRSITAATLAYASHRIPEVCESAALLDRAMRLGFLWEMGPFQVWREMGDEKILPMIRGAGFEVSKRVWSMDDLSDPEDPRTISLAQFKMDSSRVVAHHSGASLIDLGDGVLALEFHTKMNVIGEEILKMANLGLDHLAKKFDALVIGNQGENFSAGANLMLMLMLAQEEDWEEIERAIRMFQNLNLRLKYAPKPVVAAVHQRALGGGCEIVMHAPLVCAASESYLGLVETAAGIIPAGGGTKEMISRACERGGGKKPVETIAKAFQTIASARVSTSALEARKIGFLREGTAFVMNQDFLLGEAKRLAVSAVQKGVKPSAQAKLIAFGKPLYDSLAQSVDALLQERKMTEHDAEIAKKLAFVMAGGDHAAPKEVTEQHFLDLEREAFLSLCGGKKTQERMIHLLKTGKPLRN